MTSFFKKHWPLVGIALLILLASIYIFGGQEKVEEESRFADMVLEKGVELMENISFTLDDPDTGRRRVLEAKKVKVSDDQTTYTGIDFLIKLELQDGSQIELRGERGVYDRNSGEVTLKGNVNGLTDNGYRIVTDHLLYKEEEGYVETDAPVEIIGPFFSVSGQGLYFNQEKRILRILSDVTAHMDQTWIDL